MKRILLLLIIVSCILTTIGFLWKHSNQIKYAGIEDKLLIIMSSPMSSSRSQDYITRHRNVYDDIINMGKFSFNYLSNKLAHSSHTGLKKVIMEQICYDIIDRSPVKTSFGNGWYEKYIEMKQKYPSPR